MKMTSVVLSVLSVLGTTACVSPESRDVDEQERPVVVQSEPVEAEYLGRASSEWARTLAEASPTEAKPMRASLAEGGADSLDVVFELLLLHRGKGGDLPGTSVFTHARYSLVKMEGQDDEIVRRLQLLLDQGPESRETALMVLRMFGTRARAAVPVVIPLTDEGDDQARGLATSTLSWIGSDDAAAIRKLIELSEDPSSRVRGAAVGGLGQASLNRDEAFAAIQERLDDSDEGVVARAIRCLTAYESEGARDLLPRIRDLEGSDDPEVSAAAKGVVRYLSGELPGMKRR